jgi:hypothetical protein
VTNVDFWCRVISNRYWVENVKHTIQHTGQVPSHVGVISTAAMEAVSTPAFNGAPGVWVKASFTTIHQIPSSGSIYIFLKDNTKIKPMDKCKLFLASDTPSDLTHGALTGIDCIVVAGTDGHFGWYITGFATLLPAKKVIIRGQVEIINPTAAVTGDILNVYTYGSQEPGGVDIQTRGRSIDFQQQVAITITPKYELAVDFSETYKKPIQMTGD